jgi:lipopolysaccharide transport system permease protein
MATVEHVAPGREGLEPVVVHDHRPSPLELVRQTWRMRGLLPRLGPRQMIKGFAGTKLGPSWLVIRPVVSIFGMALLFGSVLQAPSAGVPYLLFLLVGMVGWMTFQRGLFWSTRSFDIYRKVAGRVQIPTLLVPTAALMLMLIEVGIVAVRAAGTAGFYWATEGELALELARPEALLGVAGILLAGVLAWALGLWLGTLNGLARDVRLTLTLVLPVWLYATPVIYPISALPDKWHFLATINPVSAPVELVKEGFLDAGELTGAILAVSLVTTVVVGASGLWFIARLSPRLLRARTFADDEEEEELL